MKPSSAAQLAAWYHDAVYDPKAKDNEARSAELAERELGALGLPAQVVKHVGDADGMNIVVNSGSAAGQDEPHFHVHVIPRCSGDGFDVPLPFAGSSMPDRTVLDATAVRIMTELRDPVRALRRASAEEHAPVPDAARPTLRAS